MTKVARKAEPEQEIVGTETLEGMFARWQPELLGTLFYLVGNMEDARDSFQEAFLKCWRHRDELPDVQNVKAWIFRIALNTGRDMRQTAWRRKRHSLPNDEQLLPGSPSNPHAELENREQLAQVRQAVRHLRTEEQEVFLLRQNGGLSYEEIAEAAGIPLGTVKTRMRMAIQKLRSELACEGS